MKQIKLFLFLAVVVLLGACGNNTENVADGTEGGVVFTVGETQYRINLRVMTAAGGAADFVAQSAKDADGNNIDISTLVDSSDENARRIYYGALRWDQLSDAEKLAVDDILSKANFMFNLRHDNLGDIYDK